MRQKHAIRRLKSTLPCKALKAVAVTPYQSRVDEAQAVLKSYYLMTYTKALLTPTTPHLHKSFTIA